MTELLQWFAIAILAFLLLGLYRTLPERMPHYAMGERDALDSIAGPKIGESLTSRLAEQLDALATRDVPKLLAFVTENCPGCRRLIANIQDASDDLEQVVDVILVLREPSPEFCRVVHDSNIAHIALSDARWRDLTIIATPLLVMTDESFVVEDTTVGVELSALLSNLRRPAEES